VQLKSKFDFKDDIKVSATWIQQIDEKLKIIFADQINLTNLWNKPSKANYNFGVKLEYSI
jgi:hypothetical protein